MALERGTVLKIGPIYTRRICHPVRCTRKYIASIGISTNSLKRKVNWDKFAINQEVYVARANLIIIESYRPHYPVQLK